VAQSEWEKPSLERDEQIFSTCRTVNRSTSIAMGDCGESEYWVLAMAGSDLRSVCFGLLTHDKGG
jgi:hypothetical protein